MKKMLPSTLIRSIKFIVMAKLTFFFTCLAVIQSSAKVHSQDNELKIQMKDAMLEQVFKEIRKQSDYYFLYDAHLLASQPKVNPDISQASITDVLNHILPETLDYEIVDNTVVIQKATKHNIDIAKGGEVEDTEVTVTGTVTDENGEPLVGASVVIKGTSNGTITDVDGKYTLSAKEDAVLVVSFIGYASQEILISGRSVIDVQMAVDTQSLEEIVVVGYGTQERANVTGAIAGIDAKKFENFPVTSFDQGMAGQIAGVQVNQGSGSPGSSPIISIRGTGTITAGTNPLIVIDDFPTDNINLNDINPNDIESIQVLKDASAAAIYGSRGSNGVLLVTTRRGETDKLNVNFNTYHGVQKVTNTYDLANAYEWAEFQSEFLLTRKSGDFKSKDDLPPLYKKYLAGEKGLFDTDWQDEIFRSANISSYQLSLSGGSKKTNFYISGEFFNQEGVIVSSDFKRYSLRTNVTTSLLKSPESSFIKSIDFGVNLSSSYTTNERVSESHHNNDGIVITGVFAYPNFAARNADGSLNISEQIRFGEAPIGQGLNGNGARFENPLAVAIHRQNPIERARLLGNTYLDFELIEGLSFKTSLGFNYSSERNRMFRPSTIGRRRNPVPGVTALASNSTRRVFNWVNENTLTYRTTLDNSHNISFLVGYTIQKENIQKNSIGGSGFATNNTPTMNAASNITGASSDEEEWALLSYLGRATYDFNGKYLMTASIRTDGSSRFGENTKWGVFPSASVGWRVSQEDFFIGLGEVVSDFKIRASYGRTGNNQIPNYGSVSLLEPARYTFNGKITSGLANSTAPNGDLSWESTDQFDIGFDIGFFDDKLTLYADYYVSTTKDMLLNVPVPSQSGYKESLQNFGSVRNKGIELMIELNKIMLGPIEWSSSLNFSTNKNEVLKLGPEKKKPIIRKHHITRIGSPIGLFYGWNSIGIYNTQEEIDNSASVKGAKPGDYIWEDVNNDGKIDDEDRKVLGSPFPDFTYGFSSTFKFKGIDVSFLLQGSEGAKVYNFTRFFLTLDGGFANALAERVNERWRSPSRPGNGKWGRAGSTQKNFDRSNLNIEDASYLRIRNITLGYTFSSDLTERVKIQKARIYISSINPFTFTNYLGYNPESNAGTAEALTGSVQGDPLTPGVDWGNYPTAKSITIGLNLTF